MEGLQIGSEVFLQDFEGFVEVIFNSLGGNAQAAGDFGVGNPVDPAHDEHVPASFGELPVHTGDQHFLEYRLSCCEFRILTVRCPCGLDQRLVRAADLFMFAVVDEQMVRDGQEVGEDRSLRFQMCSMIPEPDECILHQVVSELRIAHSVEQVPEDRRLVEAEHAFQGRGVSATEGVEEVFVIGEGRDHGGGVR